MWPHRRLSDITAAASQRHHLREGVAGSVGPPPPPPCAWKAPRRRRFTAAQLAHGRPNTWPRAPLPLQSCRLCILTISIIQRRHRKAFLGPVAIIMRRLLSNLRFSLSWEERAGGKAGAREAGGERSLCMHCGETNLCCACPRLFLKGYFTGRNRISKNITDMG